MIREGDIINVPYLGENKIEKDIYDFFLSFKNNNYNDFIFRISQISPNPHILDSKIRTLVYLCFCHNFIDSKKFFKRIFEEDKGIISTQILQVFSHRIYEIEGFSLDLIKILESTISRSLDLNLDKWKISGKFFLGFYSENKNYCFLKYMDCLNSNNNLDYDFLMDKIVYIVNWLRFFFPSDSNKKIKNFLKEMELKCGDDYILFFILVNNKSINSLREEDFKETRNTLIFKKILFDIYKKNQLYDFCFK